MTSKPGPNQHAGTHPDGRGKSGEQHGKPGPAATHPAHPAHPVHPGLRRYRKEPFPHRQEVVPFPEPGRAEGAVAGSVAAREEQIREAFLAVLLQPPANGFEAAVGFGAESWRLGNWLRKAATSG